MTEGPTSATSMWTSEPHQTQKRGQGKGSSNRHVDEVMRRLGRGRLW